MKTTDAPQANESVSRIADQKPCTHEWMRAGKREASVWLCLQCGATSDKHPLTALREIVDGN